jgi:glycosyltransferase involved in cell wall biosynthesis
MKILYHHRIRSKDGQYVHVEELTTALRALGHEIIVVGPTAVETEVFGADAGFVAWMKRHLPQALYELLEFGYAIADYFQLVKAVRRHRPDCLYERYNLYLPSGVWVKRRFKLPMLLEVNAPIYDERKKYNGIAVDALARWTEHTAWRGADYVLPVTQVLAERIEQAGVPSRRVVVIPNGINPARFRDVPSIEDAKRRLGLENRFVLGFVGFIREWHGLERVIDLVARDGDERYLLLVGDGPARAGLEGRARQLGISQRVRVTGVVSRDEVANYIACFDVALQPDVVAYASPLKLFEYLALGRVIVAPALPNIKEVLTHGENAILFEPGDTASFAAAVKLACEDERLRMCVAQGAHKTIARRGLTWEHNARTVARLFGDLLGRNVAVAARGP